METSSHNSEVVHAGLYYQPGSLKAKLCVEGHRRMIDLAQRNNIPHNVCGKWIVAATQDDVPGLLSVKRNASQCGVDLTELSSAELKSESSLRVASALLSPKTAIIDSHAYLHFLHHVLERRGGVAVLRHRLKRVEPLPTGGFLLSVQPAEGPELEVRCETVINAAGLESDRVAGLVMGEKTPSEYRLHLSQGRYFAYRGPPLLQHPKLIYPVPDAGARSLGVHSTISLGGQTKFGPDKLACEKPDYSFPAIVDSLRTQFGDHIRRYFPSVKDDQLHPDYIGIRPALAPLNDKRFHDFIISEETSRGFPGLVNLLGIESPGLTASMPIAEEVARLLGYPTLTELTLDE